MRNRFLPLCALLLLGPVAAGEAFRLALPGYQYQFPRDHFSHPEFRTEWWYYTGHCKTSSGKRFGFELVFFKRRTDLDQFGILPLRIVANPMYAAHFAISEIEPGRFQYEHLRSFGTPLDTPVEMRDDRYSLR